MNREQILERWAAYIKREKRSWENREFGGAEKDWYEFAKWLGVDEITMSHWKNARRYPQDSETIDRMNDKGLTGVYEILGKAPRVPNNPYVQLANKLMPRLPENAQAAFAAALEKAAEQADDPDVEQIEFSFRLSATG